MDDILNKFHCLTQKPVKFLSVQNDVKSDIKNLVKTVYDFTKSQESDKKTGKTNALKKLIVDDFDEEQIWQEIELQNAECWDQLVWDVASCISLKNDLNFPIEIKENIPVQSLQNKDPIASESDELSEDQTDFKQTSIENKKIKPKKYIKESIVDDKFFKLQDMEQFLLKEERQNGKSAGSDSEEEQIDMFEDIDDEDLEDEDNGGKDMMYSDFFVDGGDEINESTEYQDQSEENNNLRQKVKSTNKHIESDKKKKVTFAEMSESDDDSVDSEDKNETSQDSNKVANKDEKKSEFELRQQRLQQQIARLEEKTLSDPSWQLKGEVDATKRPQNSLLQEVVDFDLTTRPAPIITEETTLTLEEIIKQRVKDKAWDDVVRKEKPVDDQLTYRKTEILDHSKSKQSLAQVYEAEYLKQKQALSGEVEEEKEPESHTQIREAMNKLFAQLDALTHYHYTPKAPQAEVKIVTNTPAISMEEVAPVATSDAAMLAPEEVKRKRKGDLISKDERTKTDKNRERRKKKKLQHTKGIIEKVTGHRNTKKAVETNDKSLKTSKAFFQQLNDDTTSLMKNKNKRNVKNKGQ